MVVIRAMISSFPSPSRSGTSDRALTGPGFLGGSIATASHALLLGGSLTAASGSWFAAVEP